MENDIIEIKQAEMLAGITGQKLTFRLPRRSNIPVT